MSIRITDNAQFTSVVDNLFNIRRQYQDVMEKLTSQKNINNISDDAIGVTRVLGFKQTNQAIGQYQSNIDNTSSWLSATEGKLNNANDILTEARTLAVSQATGTANADTRKITAQKVQNLMDEMRSLANSQLGDRYLFAGSRSDETPFTSEEAAATIDTPVAGGANSYEGVVTQSGTYTGETNKSYVLKITTDGTQAAAKFKISDDGGKTWGAESVGAIGNSVVLDDGITLTFDNGTFAANDLFYVNAYTPGYYKGNDGALNVTINKDSSANYNITGAEAFTDKGGGSIDIFKSLQSFKDALTDNNVDGISTAIGNMKTAQDQIILCTAKCGSRANRMEMAKNNLSELELNMTSLISATEDADVAELATTFSMKEVALQAAYEVASRISSNSIINFLK
ncbi:MAG: flagellar hook-associated protein FlgL [Syntrophus sp. (in: bacteria)]